MKEQRNRNDYRELVKWKKVDLQQLKDSIDLNIPTDVKELITSKTRVANIVQWRSALACSYWLHGMSLTRVGQLINRHHSTVLHSIAKLDVAIEGFNHVKVLDRVRMINYYAYYRIETKKCNQTKFEL